jgi:hypothetical protein
MSHLQPKIHWEWRPGILWCQAQRPGKTLLRSALPHEVTCRHCRHYLDRPRRQEPDAERRP